MREQLLLCANDLAALTHLHACSACPVTTSGFATFGTIALCSIEAGALRHSLSRINLMEPLFLIDMDRDGSELCMTLGLS